MNNRKRANKVKAWRQRTKKTLVKEAGGKCQRCGYSKCIAALCFHHRDPSQKAFRVGSGNTYSLEKQREEAKKCDLLCANCHAEVHWPVAE